MAQPAGGTMLDEPSPTRRERRQRRERARPDRSASTAPDGDGGGSTTSRQARRARAERRRFWIMLGVVAVLLGAAVLAGEVIRSDSDEGPGRDGAAAAQPAPAAANTLLLGHRGADGRLDALLLVGSAKAAASVLLLPVGTQLEVPSLGPQTLADLPNEGDTSLLETTVENLLGVKVAKSLIVDDAGLNAALAPASPMDVELSREVQFEGSAEGIISPGRRRTSTGQAARLLVAKQPGSELDRLVTVQDVLDAWLVQLRNLSTARATLHDQPELAPLVALARRSDRRTDTLPVESVTTAGDEGFKPRAADVAEYVAAAFPDALLAPAGRRPRVEILNGTGAVGLAQTIAAQIVPAGGQVTLAGNLREFGLEETQVVYYRPADRAAAQRLLRALGCGSLKQADKEIGVVDVTILAGADCFRTGDAPAPS